MVLQMTRHSSLSLALGFIAVCVAMVVGLTSARADIYVIESTASGVNVGVRLTMDDTVAIPAGAYIRAVLPSGKTQTIRGPYSGKVADLAKGAAQNEGVMAWVRNMMKTGGSTETTTGATRSVSARPAPPRGFSLVEVPSTVDGDICLLKGGKVLLTRGSAARMDRVSVVDLANGARAEVVWEAGSQTAAWPAALTLRPDGAYQLFLQDRPKRQITARVLDKQPSDDDVLTELHRFGCKHQFDAWLRQRMAPGKS
jgi:hypothetical protein